MFLFLQRAWTYLPWSTVVVNRVIAPRASGGIVTSSCLPKPFGPSLILPTSTVVTPSRLARACRYREFFVLPLYAVTTTGTSSVLLLVPGESIVTHADVPVE